MQGTAVLSAGALQKSTTLFFESTYFIKNTRAQYANTRTWLEHDLHWIRNYDTLNYLRYLGKQNCKIASSVLKFAKNSLLKRGQF